MTLVRDRLLNTPHSGIRRMLELTREVADPLLLISGDPNFRTPDHVIFGAAEAAAGGATGYPPAEGIAPLRAAIAKKLAQINRLEAHQDQICVVTGACGGLYTSLMLLVDPGDEVLIPNPGWSNYAAMVHVLGGRAVGYPVGPTTGWELDPDVVESAFTARTRAIILNSPGNPTGVVWEPDRLAAVVGLAARRGVPVISDEAYDQLVFESEPFSVGSVAAPPELISVFTFSKTYAMTGWRIGYVHAAADFARQLSLHQEPVTSGASIVSQHAALAALEGPQDVVGQMVSAYRERRDLVADRLRGAQVGFVLPQGGFFVLVDVRAAGCGSWEFATELLRRYSVGVVPGLAFGSEGEGYVRVSLAVAPDVLHEGIARLLNLHRELASQRC